MLFFVCRALQVRIAKGRTPGELAYDWRSKEWRVPEELRDLAGAARLSRRECWYLVDTMSAPRRANLLAISAGVG